MKKINVQWTGDYPCLCSGEWKFEIDGIEICLDKLKDPSKYNNLLKDHMNTKKSYSFWSFEEDYEVIWEDEEQGLDFEDWMQSKKKQALEKDS